MKLNIKPGDKIAIVTTSSPAAALFPHIFDLGMERVRSQLGLEPVVMPHARNFDISMEQRANDLHQAWSNPDIKAIMACIGGDYQVKLIKHLKPEIIQRSPKPFFGYSDNTHLHCYLAKLGIPSFYGGSLMTQVAMNQHILPQTLASFRWCFESDDWFDIPKIDHSICNTLDWHDPQNRLKPREFEQNTGPIFYGDQAVQGTLWGGCLECLNQIAVVPGRFPSVEEAAGTILCFECSEEMTSNYLIERFLIGLGEAGYFDRLAGLAVGRPQSWNFSNPGTLTSRQQWRQEQQAIIVQTVQSYRSDLTMVLNLPFGHTDPQIILPLGGQMQIDPIGLRVSLKK